MKELKEEQLFGVNGGKYKRHYREPSALELAEINRIKEEMKNTLDAMHKAQHEKIQELRKKYEKLINELVTYVNVRQIDPKYRKY